MRTSKFRLGFSFKYKFIFDLERSNWPRASFVVKGSTLENDVRKLHQFQKSSKIFAAKISQKRFC